MSFPIELLELVFSFCYLGSINEEPALSTLFPYYLAEVDPLWKRILLKFPNYWTQVVSKTTNGIADARDLSRHVPNKFLGVTIIRRSGNAIEGARIKNLMELLESNMFRRELETFFIDVYASSPLPSITTDFNHVPPTFKYLRDVNDNTVSGHEVHMPSYIIAMVHDGYTFSRNLPWLRHCRMLMSLDISPSVGNRSLGILDVDWALQTVFQMTSPPKEGTSKPQNLTVEHMYEPSLLMTLTRSMYLSLLCGQRFPRLQELHLTCGVFLREIPQCEQLILEGYDRAHFFISGLFDETLFVSPALHLIDCTGFTDAELDLLSKLDPATKCPLFSINLKCLKLTRCRNFTIAALKDMVNARGQALWNFLLAFLKRRHFTSLMVSGYGTPLAVEDGEWLNTHLMHFQWEGGFSFATGA